VDPVGSVVQHLTSVAPAAVVFALTLLVAMGRAMFVRYDLQAVNDCRPLKQAATQRRFLASREARLVSRPSRTPRDGSFPQAMIDRARRF
jgi:hypothetical protein